MKSRVFDVNKADPSPVAGKNAKGSHAATIKKPKIRHWISGLPGTLW